MKVVLTVTAVVLLGLLAGTATACPYNVNAVAVVQPAVVAVPVVPTTVSAVAVTPVAVAAPVYATPVAVTPVFATPVFVHQHNVAVVKVVKGQKQRSGIVGAVKALVGGAGRAVRDVVGQ